MSDLRKAAEMALEALDCLPWQASPIAVEATKALRQALDDKPPVKTYCGGKPNYCTPEATPDVDAVNTSQERVDETAKGEQEPVAWIMEMPPPSGADRSVRMTSCKEVTQDWENAIPLYTAPPKREWVELAKEDMPDGDNPMFDTNEFYAGMAWAAAKLKEKNT